MNDLLSWLLPLLAAILTTWMAIIELTLRNGARVAVERALEMRHRSHLWKPIEDRLVDVTVCVSFLRVLMATTFLCLWTYDLSGSVDDFSTAGFFVGVSTGVALLWLMVGVVAVTVATVVIAVVVGCVVLLFLP